ARTVVDIRCSPVAVRIGAAGGRAEGERPSSPGPSTLRPGSIKQTGSEPDSLSPDPVPDPSSAALLALPPGTCILDDGESQDPIGDSSMRSPFPGMDPYIEARGLWGDFHHDLISEIKYALAQSAPERYLVRAGERSYVVLVEQEGKTSRPFLPDVSVTT